MINLVFKVNFMIIHIFSFIPQFYIHFRFSSKQCRGFTVNKLLLHFLLEQKKLFWERKGSWGF